MSIPELILPYFLIDCKSRVIVCFLHSLAALNEFEFIFSFGFLSGLDSIRSVVLFNSKAIESSIFWRKE
tara:strand:+ start:266 stop:472 length:207 start_codon:yes stop_codon:yes gene_type:complete